MLLRTATHDYNWWSGNSKRFKQSKWLDTDLEEMDEKVNAMLKLIEGDADSFGKKAELYFRRRPELIHYVEEMYKSYKSLAERYGRILEELNKANHTIASICPDQVEFGMHQRDEDDEGSLKAVGSVDFRKYRSSPDLSHRSSTPTKKDHCHLPRKTRHRRRASQISQEQAQEEIEKLQKDILVLQTEKEYIRSSYQGTLKRYLQIEKEITEMQEEVCILRDAHNAHAIIEDDEARALMAATAIKTCEDSLVSIQEKQKVSNEETRIESERIKDAKRQLSTLKGEYDESKVHATVNSAERTEITSAAVKAEEFNFLKGETMELQTMCEKVKEHLETSSAASVMELEEKIDEHVDKVIDLEVTVQTQTGQIKRLNAEIDELHEHLRNLENEKMLLVDNSNSLTEKLKEAEDELQRVQQLERCIHHNNGILEKQFIEVCHKLSSLSEKLLSPNIQQEEETSDELAGEECSYANSTRFLEVLEITAADAAETELFGAQNYVLVGEVRTQIKESVDLPELQELLLHSGLL